jgi:hypothetical protein
VNQQLLIFAGGCMNTNLKRLAGTVLAVLAIAIGANAQASHLSQQEFVKKYSLEMFGISLQDKEYPGVVEGTLYNIVECKNKFPELDYSDLLDPVSTLAKDNNDLVIGYKAYLTGLYLAHSSNFHVSPVSGAESHEYLFKQIADQLEEKLVAVQGEPAMLSETK